VASLKLVGSRVEAECKVLALLSPSNAFLGRKFDTGKIFTERIRGQEDFEGQEGEDLANSVLDTTRRRLEGCNAAIVTRTPLSDRTKSPCRGARCKPLVTHSRLTPPALSFEEGRAIRQESRAQDPSRKRRIFSSPQKSTGSCSLYATVRSHSARST